MEKRNIIIGTIVVLFIAVGAAWAMGYFHRTDPAVAELQQMRDQMRSATDADRPKFFEQFRAKMDGLTDAQRQEFRQSSQGQFRQDMAKRMNEFFAMSPADQRKRLDEMIDQMQKRQQQRPANGNQAGGGQGGNRGGGRNMTDGQREQARKDRLDNTNPVQRGQMDKFRQMLGDRMQERGVTPPAGGRGGFGMGRG